MVRAIQDCVACNVQMCRIGLKSCNPDELEVRWLRTGLMAERHLPNVNPPLQPSPDPLSPMRMQNCSALWHLNQRKEPRTMPFSLALLDMAIAISFVRFSMVMFYAILTPLLPSPPW
jgi:hypothetical protein